MYTPIVDGQELTFDVGGLIFDIFTMFDRETGSVWTHLDGKAIQGPLAGARLKLVPVPQMTWAEWRAAYPSTSVLSPDTPFSNRYRTARVGRHSESEDRFGDDRLPSNALVVAVEAAGHFKGYPIDAVADAGGGVNDVLGGLPLVVVYDGVAQTGIAFSRTVEGQVLDFRRIAGDRVELTDEQTGTVWDYLGRAISGPLKGESLDFALSYISEWYGWSAYHPDTGLFAAAD